MSDDAKVSLGKGRPTPKRSEAQKRRGGPVAPPPKDRREAARRLRQEAASERRATRSGSVLLARDAGPVRAAMRDVVDGRHSAAVLLLPAALALVVISVVAPVHVKAVAGRIWVLLLLVVLVDLVALAIRARRAVRAEFPGEGRVRSHVTYAMFRSTVVPRFRMPPPRVHPRPLLRR